MQRQARHRVHQDRLAHRRAAARQPAKVHRCLHVHERQRHELGETTGLSLQIPDAQQMPRPMDRALGVAVHDRGRGAQPLAVRRAHHVQPLLRVDLVRRDDLPDLVVQDLRRRAGQGAQPRRLQLPEKLAHGLLQRRRALEHLQRRERMHMHVRQRRLDGLGDTDIGVAGIVGMDAALQAHLGRPARPGLLGPPHDLAHLQVVRRAAQRLVRLALGEGAERAAIVTNVGIVDVAVDHVTDHLAADAFPKCVGGLDHPVVVDVARREQPHDLALVQPLAFHRAVQDPLDAAVHAGEARPRRKRDRRQPRRPAVVARQPVGIGRLAHLRRDRRRQPACRRLGIGRIHRQPLHQDLAHRGGPLRKVLDLRPRRFRVHVIRRHRRHAAPIVDPRGDQLVVFRRRQVRRRLQVHLRPQDQPRRGHGPQHVLQVRLVRPRPLGVGLGAEILHDHFLDMTVFAVQVANGEQRIQPLRPRLADAD